MLNLSRGKGFLALLPFCTVFSLSPALIRANSYPDVVINEICWMGTEISYNDEWIELYNNTDYIINLNDWHLKASDGTPEIELSGEIFPKSFYLLERTDDETVLDASSDKIYFGSLGNKGEALNLYNDSGNLIDSVDCKTGWFAGNNETKQTMERKNPKLPGNDPNNWESSLNTGGTPKEINGRSSTDNPAAGTEIKEQATPIKNTEEKTESAYPQGIFFNEILPSPEGTDEENEWIELYNENNFEADLAGWQIADVIGTTKIYIFPKETRISAKSFLVISRPETKIILNNDKDGLKLLQPNGNLIDEISYENAPQPPPAQSYNRTGSGWIWSKKLTPNSANIITELKQETVLTTKDETAENSFSKTNQLAAAEEFFPKDKESLPVFLIAVLISFSGGLGILFLKKVLQQKKNLLE